LKNLSFLGENFLKKDFAGFAVHFFKNLEEKLNFACKSGCLAFIFEMYAIAKYW
jgi:hypothetical protein